MGPCSDRRPRRGTTQDAEQGRVVAQRGAAIGVGGATCDTGRASPDMPARTFSLSCPEAAKTEKVGTASSVFHVFSQLTPPCASRCVDVVSRRDDGIMPKGRGNLLKGREPAQSPLGDRSPRAPRPIGCATRDEHGNARQPPGEYSPFWRFAPPSSLLAPRYLEVLGRGRGGARLRSLTQYLNRVRDM